MSLSAALIESRNYLRANLEHLNNPGISIKIMQDPRPVPRAGQEFIALIGEGHEPGIESNSNQAIHETYRMRIAISRKIGSVPFSRRGEQVYIEDTDLYDNDFISLEERAREIVSLLHQNWTLLGNINTRLAATHPIMHPWVWDGTDPNPQVVGPDHYHAESSDTESGLLLNVRFGGMFRSQTTSEIDNKA